MKLDTTLEETIDIVNSCLKDTGCAFGGWPNSYEMLCPIYAQGRDFSACLGGIVYVIRALIGGNIEYSQALAEHVFSCSQCGACDISCYVLSIHRTDIKPSDFIRLLRSQLVQRGFLPEGYLKSQYERLKTAKGPTNSVISTPTNKNETDVVLYTEDADTGTCKTLLNNTVNLLERIGYKTTILSNENCGASHYDLGFWSSLPGDMINCWKALAAWKNKPFVFIDPHHLEFISHRYPEFVPEYKQLKTAHISQILADALKQGRLTSTRESRLRVSYHDPCRLGRVMGILDAPREVLSSLHGIELVEMHPNRSNTFCCGARAFGNYYPNISTNTAKLRLKEFYATGADILVTACPNCKAQFQKVMPAGEKDRVKDLVEIVDERTR